MATQLSDDSELGFDVNMNKKQPIDPLIAAPDLSRVEALIAERQSDTERWSGEVAINRIWSHRLTSCVAMIRPNTRILDIGCGRMDLRHRLPLGCQYIPADIVKRSEDTLLIEINKGCWPEVTADYAVALGVLEYVYDLPEFLFAAQKCAPMLIFSYHVRCSNLNESRQVRLKNSWLSDFSMTEIVSAIEHSGGRLQHLFALSEKQHFDQYMIRVSFRKTSNNLESGLSAST